MATITKNKVLNQATFGGTPYGNLTALPFNLTTNAVGAFVDSDVATGIALGDVVRLGVLPAGFKLLDSQVIVSDAFTAAMTGSIGFQYVDGVDSTVVPQSANYFGAGISLNATGRVRNTATNAPVSLPKDAYLILTTAGAACNTTGVADVIVEGIGTGAP